MIEEIMPTIAAAARKDVVIPCPTNLIPFLYNDKVSAIGTSDHIDSCTHTFRGPPSVNSLESLWPSWGLIAQLTGDSGPDYQDIRRVDIAAVVSPGC